MWWLCTVLQEYHGTTRRSMGLFDLVAERICGNPKTNNVMIWLIDASFLILKMMVMMDNRVAFSYSSLDLCFPTETQNNSYLIISRMKHHKRHLAV